MDSQQLPSKKWSNKTKSGNYLPDIPGIKWENSEGNTNRFIDIEICKGETNRFMNNTVTSLTKFAMNEK